MGEVVNSACHLANKAGRGWRKNVLISEKVYENISKDVQDYFSKCQIDSKTYYESDIVWSEYEDWIEQNYNLMEKVLVVTPPTFYYVSTTIAVHILQYFAKICISCTEMTDT